MPEPDLTGLRFFIDKTDPSVTEALCRDLRSLAVKARVYISPRFCMARLTPEMFDWEFMAPWRACLARSLAMLMYFNDCSKMQSIQPHASAKKVYNSTQRLPDNQRACLLEPMLGEHCQMSQSNRPDALDLLQSENTHPNWCPTVQSSLSLGPFAIESFEATYKCDPTQNW